MEMPFWLAATLVEHCGWLRSQARVDDAVPLANEARDILLGLGARPWLERLEGAVPAATVEPVPAGP